MNLRFRFAILGLVAAFALLLAVGVGAQVLPRPEYPLPQMVRADWMNLNGEWQFAETDDDAVSLLGDDAKYPDKIIVPFCRESKLSGLARKGFIKNVWYKRTFDAPKWSSPRLVLHIGACDYKTKVWVNGNLLGEHVGGSAPIVFEVTKFVKPGANTVIVHAFDDTRSMTQPCGKQAQSPESQGCVYTRTTGIWQTVWLEGVGSSFIRDYKIDTDPDNSCVTIQTEVDGSCQGVTLKAVASAGKKVVGSAETKADWRNGRLVIKLANKHIWTNADPFLYDLKLTLVKDGKVIDTLGSYFGLRSVQIEGAAILINKKPVFQRLVLDQGFYPDGVWTAPTDADLKLDIDMSMAAGFNGARLHQKVFDPRYLYWSDKLGYLVWGEFPNWGFDTNKTEGNLPYINEWVEVMRRDRNHPSIIGWCPFNETGGGSGPLQNTVYYTTRAIDPSRPVIDTSGWAHSVSDRDMEVLDWHDYTQEPKDFRDRWIGKWNPDTKPVDAKTKVQPFFLSEYGGIGWELSGGGWGYGQAPKDLEAFYQRIEGLTDVLLESRCMFGFCYTQITDVEQEHNGLYTYDRKPKFDMARIKKILSKTAAYEKDPPFNYKGK